MQLIRKFIKKYLFISWYNKKYSYFNPWYYQNKNILKVFKKCPIKIHIGKYEYIMICDPIKNYPIQLSFNGLGWKEKYYDPDFEYPPNILFKLFNFEFRIIWTWGNYLKDTIYWEGVLQYYVYEKSLTDIINTDIWINSNKELSTLKTFKYVKMKTIEECLKILPEVLYVTPEKYIEFVGEEFDITEEDIANESYYENAYIAITTDSARYKIRSNDYVHWDDLVVFQGDPTECCNQLVDWYEEYFK